MESIRSGYLASGVQFSSSRPHSASVKGYRMVLTFFGGTNRKFEATFLVKVVEREGQLPSKR